MCTPLDDVVGTLENCARSFILLDEKTYIEATRHVSLLFLPAIELSGVL